MTSGRILIVDDDPDIVLYLSSLLEDEGYEPMTASDSRTALDALSGFEPEAILVDVMMPGRSGLDLLVQLRRHPRWQDLPIVVITGNDRILEDDCQSYLGAHDGVRGPDGALGKPIDPETLLAVVREVLRQGRAGDRWEAPEA